MDSDSSLVILIAAVCRRSCIDQLLPNSALARRNTARMAS